MPGRVSFLRAAALLLTLLAPWLSTSAAEAPMLIPREALVGVEDIERVFQNGARLESERRWDEVLSYYENALKTHPGRQDIAERLMLAKVHLDVARRYADASFTELLGELSERQALEAYSELLFKIDTHYVQSPDWRELIERGSTNLRVALSEPAFRLQIASQTSAEQIEAFHGEVAQLLKSLPVRSRHEARDAAGLAARIAMQRLQIPPQAVVLEYACGAVGALDEYSGFLTGEQLDDVFSQIEGNFVGLGVELKAEGQSLLIVSVIPGGPAHEVGVRGGDRIVAVDGKSTRDVSTDAAADMLRGPEGSEVEVDVFTPSGVTRRLRLVRRSVDVPSVEDAGILDGRHGVAYLRLTNFQKTTSAHVDAALWKLHREGMRVLIVDVRDNPGGLLSASVEVADKFVSGGAIVATRGRNSREDFDYQAHAPGTWRVPLIVLIDGDTASASEIFAAAIRDHRRGAVVGQRSYGKGSVQGIFPLNVADMGVRLTTAKFYSPSGEPISHRGVPPDYVVHVAAKPDTQLARPGNDPLSDEVLQSALELARKMAGNP